MLRLCESPTTPLSTKSSKILSGLFAECDKRNQNERIYPERVYLPALESIMPKIKEGRLLGELDHPSDRDEVCLSNVSHVIKECTVDGAKVYGTIELLDTPAGKIAQALHEAGIPLGISSRGVGNTRRVNEGDEVTEFNLITYDLVADPSFSDAILTESAKINLKSKLDEVARTLPLNESAGDSTTIRTKINDIKNSLDKAPSLTSTLVESIGTLTAEKESMEEKLSESLKRNKSLKSNMRKLQDSYNLLSESVATIQEDHNNEVAKLTKDLVLVKESYEAKISEMEDELIGMRKRLAIEKRGLSCDKIMPILEGLITVKEIDAKLDSLKQLGARRYVTAENVSSLTEGLDISTKSDNKLTRIVSRV